MVKKKTRLSLRGDVIAHEQKDPYDLAIEENKALKQQLESIREEFESHAKVSKQFIKGKEYTAHLIMLEGEDILSKTEISPFNVRDQDNLTEESLQDILPSLREGQDEYGLGYVDKDGIIQVLNSSRRRMGTYIAGTPYILWVIEEDIADLDLLDSAFTRNQSKSQSYWENGRYFCMYLAAYKESNEQALTQKQLAEKVGLSESYISKALGVHEIPKEVFAAFPSRTAIDSALSESLLTFWKKLGSKLNKDKFIQHCQDFDKEGFLSERPELSINEHDKAVFNELCARYRGPKRKAKTSSKAEPLALFEDKVNKVSVQFIQHNNKKAHIEFKSVPSDKLEEIQQAIQAILNKSE